MLGHRLLGRKGESWLKQVGRKDEEPVELDKYTTLPTQFKQDGHNNAKHDQGLFCPSPVSQPSVTPPCCAPEDVLSLPSTWEDKILLLKNFSHNLLFLRQLYQ